MTDLAKLADGLTENPDQVLRELSDLQTWCALMSSKDSGGVPAADLIQRTRILIIELRRHLQDQERRP